MASKKLEHQTMYRSAFSILVCGLILSLVAVGFHTPSCGAQKPETKTIYFDIAHGEPHPLDNFRELVSTLSKRGYAILEPDKGPLTPEKLEKVDVLVIIGPKHPFSIDEFYHVRSFLALGGGMLVIPGRVDIINELTSGYGVSFNMDQIFDPTDHVKLENHVDVGDARAAPIIHLFEDHPVTRGVKKVSMYNTCSFSWTKEYEELKPQLLAWADEDAYSLEWEKLSSTSYVLTTKPLYEKNPPVMAAVNYVKGKIVFLTDVSPLSDRHIDEYDNKRLALNIFDWLSKPVENPDKSPLYDLLEVDEVESIPPPIPVVVTWAPGIAKPEASTTKTTLVLKRKSILRPVKAVLYLKTDLDDPRWEISGVPEPFSVESGKEAEVVIDPARTKLIRIKLSGKGPDVEKEGDRVLIRAETVVDYGDVVQNELETEVRIHVKDLRDFTATWIQKMEAELIKMDEHIKLLEDANVDVKREKQLYEEAKKIYENFRGIQDLEELRKAAMEIELIRKRVEQKRYENSGPTGLLTRLEPSLPIFLSLISVTLIFLIYMKKRRS